GLEFLILLLSCIPGYRYLGNIFCNNGNRVDIAFSVVDRSMLRHIMKVIAAYFKRICPLYDFTLEYAIIYLFPFSHHFGILEYLQNFEAHRNRKSHTRK